MGQKYSNQSTDTESSTQFGDDFCEVLEEINVKKDAAPHVKNLRLLRLKFKCKCKHEWSSHFKMNDVQECGKCKTKVKSEVVIPKGNHLVGTCECKQCDIQWKRPIKPKKSTQFLCLRCKVEKCSIISFDIQAGSYNSAKKKYFKKKKELEETLIKDITRKVEVEVTQRVEKEVAERNLMEMVTKGKEKKNDSESEGEESEEESSEEEEEEGEEEIKKMKCKVCFVSQ